MDFRSGLILEDALAAGYERDPKSTPKSQGANLHPQPERG